MKTTTMIIAFSLQYIFKYIASRGRPNKVHTSSYRSSRDPQLFIGEIYGKKHDKIVGAHTVEHIYIFSSLHVGRSRPWEILLWYQDDVKASSGTSLTSNQ